MNEYAWAMLAYFVLQGASLAFLPRWWKLAVGIFAWPGCFHVRLAPWRR